MSNNIGVFLLFSILVTVLVINQSVSSISFDSITGNSKLPSTHFAFGQETPVNATDTTSTNSTSVEIEDGVTMSDNPTGTNATSTNSESAEEDMMETEDEVTPAVLSPLKQIKSGIVPTSVVCKEGLDLIFKLNGQPACVKTTSVQKLLAWGWTQ
ncbi:hypothetical protein LBMAG54_12330 [Nitrosopumilaceae archaeon]|nr:hypothetical protein EMGBD3_13520 [Nitrosarchaeum sp.]GDY16377.1 hypothetical protein LBMAG54_12330 [Nitrosopumilaceae archaeon]